MLAHAFSRFLARFGIYYGIVIVAVTFVTMLTTAGVMGLVGALLLPLQKEFALTSADVSVVLALRLALYGLFAPFAAAFLERYGIVRCIVFALTLMISALIGSFFMHGFWSFFVLWGIMIGVATGITALVFGATVAGRWFVRQRGLVVGLLTASNATGQLVFLPLATALISAHGWHAALIPSLASLCLAAILLFFFMVDQPATIGLQPYGAEPSHSAFPAPPPMADALSHGNAFVNALQVLHAAVAKRDFWLLFGTFFICGLSTNGLIQTHFIAFCSDFGMAPVLAASVLAMIGGFDVIGTIGSGWLSDRYDSRWLLFCYYGLRGLSLLALPFCDFSLYGLSLFGVFYGLDWVATVPPTVRLASLSFGRARASVVFGWIFCGHQLGAATAAFGAGFSRTFWLSYLPAFYAAGTACLIAALMALFVLRTGTTHGARAGVPPLMPVRKGAQA